MSKEFILPELPYALDALAPVITEKTIGFHYGKHHQAYVNNLNGLVKGTPFENEELETIIKKSEGATFNNAAQVWNHTFYFFQFSPDGGGEPRGKLAEAISKQWGSFDKFKEIFNQAAAGLFGSGWVWLAAHPDGKLEIVKESNAGNPMTKGLKPVLTFDVWEHAYYLDYQNRRPDYLKEIWTILDWKVIAERY
ncbi:MAG: superoxide dismutase [Tannerella sp.]|nr:superoxide dismutase [Tannerella sp.]